MLIVDPWALRHCLTTVWPFREEVPAVKTPNINTRYVPPAPVFKYHAISTCCEKFAPIYIGAAVYFRERPVYFR